MRINKYTTEIWEDGLTVLVKEKSCNYSIENLSSPKKIVSMINGVFNLSNKAEEYLYMIALNNKNKCLGVFEVSHGTVNASLVSPREIFIRALLCGATKIVIVHNHPSGETEASADDIKVTERIKKCGEILNVSLLDHIIIANESYISLKEKGWV